jgi:hypothetical protein
MRQRPNIPKAAGLLCCAAFSTSFTVGFASPALSQSQPRDYECALSGSQPPSSNINGCPGDTTGGYETSTTSLKTDGNCDVPPNAAAPYCGAKGDAPLAVAPIEAWNVCRWVDNTVGATQAIFVPFKSSAEWQEFRSSATLPHSLLGGNVSLTNCAVPYSDNGAPPTITITPPFDTCTQISASTPNVYGRTGTSLFPFPAAPGPGFSCHAGNTSMMSAIQWKAGDVESVGAGVLSWSTHFSYSPDETLAASPSVVDAGSPITLSWSIAPYNPSDPITCSVTPGGWGPDGNGYQNGSRSGSSTVYLSTTTTFTLSCTETPNLTSVATVTATAVPPPCCGGGGGGGGG